MKQFNGDVERGLGFCGFVSKTAQFMLVLRDFYVLSKVLLHLRHKQLLSPEVNGAESPNTSVWMFRDEVITVTNSSHRRRDQTKTPLTPEPFTIKAMQLPVWFHTGIKKWNNWGGWKLVYVKGHDLANVCKRFFFFSFFF